MQKHTQFHVDKEVLTGELFSPMGCIKASFLICHGWSSKNQKYLAFAESFSKRGILVLAINLRGHGDSQYQREKYSRKDHLNDVISSIDYLKSLSNAPLIVMGKSYGGYLCSIASTLRTIDYLIISQPALYPDINFVASNDTLIQQNPDIFRSTDQTEDNNKALSAVAHYRNPLLIIESEHDEEVKQSPKYYIAASKNNKSMSHIIIKDTDHPLTKPEWREDYFNKITQWLNNYLG